MLAKKAKIIYVTIFEEIEGELNEYVQNSEIYTEQLSVNLTICS